MEQQNINTAPEASGSQALRQLRQRAKDGTLKDVLRDWLWIWSFSRRHWVAIVFYTLFGILASCIGLVSGVVSKYLIDAIISVDTRKLVPMALWMVATAVLSVVMRSLTSRFSAKLGVTMHNDIQLRAFESLLSSQWMEIRKFPTGDLLSRFTSDISTVSGCAVSWLPNVVIQLFTVLATLAVVLYFDPVMALIAFASTPVLVLCSRRLLRRQRAFNQKARKVSGDMAAYQAEVFRNVDTLKSFGVEADAGRKLRERQDEYETVTLEYNGFSIKTNMLLTALGTLVQYLALGYCLWRLWRGDIIISTVVLFLQLRSGLSSSFSSLISLIPTALSGSVAAERIRELTELDKESRTGLVHPEGHCSVTAENVSAAYENGCSVLKNVALEAPAGQIAALVGPSGEGKSTLMRLMLGLVPPAEGSLYLTDETGRQYPLGADTRHLFAYVPQGNTVLAGTIAENLRLVNPQVTEAEMEAALKDACAWEFVSQMPRGMHSPIGEGGKGLSEGQAQRIAIARALVRSAPVMLLDEVTSALDFETERQVLENLLRRGVTCIVSTHRPSVLNQCHRAYRVREGAVEQLTREEIEKLIAG